MHSKDAVSEIYNYAINLFKELSDSESLIVDFSNNCSLKEIEGYKEDLEKLFEKDCFKLSVKDGNSIRIVKKVG